MNRYFWLMHKNDKQIGPVFFEQANLHEYYIRAKSEKWVFRITVCLLDHSKVSNWIVLMTWSNSQSRTKYAPMSPKCLSEILYSLIRSISYFMKNEQLTRRKLDDEFMNGNEWSTFVWNRMSPSNCGKQGRLLANMALFCLISWS